jgi:hypothetical protein
MTEPTPTERRQQLGAAISHLELVAWQLNGLANWLGDDGHETEADMAEGAARSILAACWLLSRPFRRDLPPDRWHVS